MKGFKGITFHNCQGMLFLTCVFTTLKLSGYSGFQIVPEVTDSQGHR